MRTRVLVPAVVAGLLIALVPTTAQAAHPRYVVSASISAVKADVGATVKVSGTVAGKAAAKKTVYLQRKIGAGAWSTVGSTRTTAGRRYTFTHRVGATGAQTFRVYAPKSKYRSAGYSTARSLVGWTWLDLSRQPVMSFGYVSNGMSVTLGSTVYSHAFSLWINNGVTASEIYAKVNGSCDRATYRAGVDPAWGNTAAEWTDRVIPFDRTQSVSIQIWTATRATPRDVSVALTSGIYIFAITYGGSLNTALGVVNPRVRCRVGALPVFAWNELD